MKFERGAWTDRAPLPGGDLPGADLERFLADLERRHRWLPGALARRYGRAYGTRVDALIGTARRLDDLGEHLGDGLYEAEVEHLVRNEWAMSDEDILWRRSKLGLHVTSETTARLRAWLDRHHTDASARSPDDANAEKRPELEGLAHGPAR
jgi:glycerol-3-phosphate dehydrogenase